MQGDDSEGEHLELVEPPVGGADARGRVCARREAAVAHRQARQQVRVQREDRLVVLQREVVTCVVVRVRLRLVHPLRAAFDRGGRLRDVVHPFVQRVAYLLQLGVLAQFVVGRAGPVVDVDAEDGALDLGLQLAEFDVVDEGHDVAPVLPVVRMLVSGCKIPECGIVARKLQLVSKCV